jgi:transcription elongation factor Elf1
MTPKKQTKKIKRHFKKQEPMVKLKPTEMQYFRCPNCRQDTFQTKSKKGYETVIQCISCGEVYELEFGEDDEECVDGACEVKHDE